MENCIRLNGWNWKKIIKWSKREKNIKLWLSELEQKDEIDNKA